MEESILKLNDASEPTGHCRHSSGENCLFLSPSKQYAAFIQKSSTCGYEGRILIHELYAVQKKTLALKFTRVDVVWTYSLYGYAALRFDMKNVL